MKTTIHLPSALKPFVEGKTSIEVDAATVGEALRTLADRYPKIRTHLWGDEDRLRRFMSIFLGKEDIRFLQAEATTLTEGSEIRVVPSIAGGSSAGEFTPGEIARYSRHLMLEGVGMSGQAELKNSKVLVIGAGGLGSPLCIYLAAAGVGRLGIVDHDVVDVTNLHRQILYGTTAVGMSKVECAKARIHDINPFVEVSTHDEALTVGNALSVIEPYDVVVDGTDNFRTRYLVNDACVLLGKPNVYGSIFKFEGQVSVFNYQGGPNYRDLHAEPPFPGLIPSCAEGGVLGVLPGVIGCLQATETIKILLGKGTTLSGRLLLYDALSMRFEELIIRKDPGAPPITGLVDYDEFCGLPAAAKAAERDLFKPISALEVYSRREAGWSPFVIDVRGAEEAEIVQLPFTDRLQPHPRIDEIADELPRDRDLLVYCRSGVRSAVACRRLIELGFDRQRLFNLSGGVLGWAETLDPSMPTY